MWVGKRSVGRNAVLCSVTGSVWNKTTVLTVLTVVGMRRTDDDDHHSDAMVFDVHQT